MKTLSKEQVLRLHNALLETFGGTAGVRDDGLLESALNAPFATFGGQYLYPSVQAKAAQLGFSPAVPRRICGFPFRCLQGRETHRTDRPVIPNHPCTWLSAAPCFAR